jgi:RNA polymerase sigma factor (sigma-70 family)
VRKTGASRGRVVQTKPVTIEYRRGGLGPQSRHQLRGPENKQARLCFKRAPHFPDPLFVETSPSQVLTVNPFRAAAWAQGNCHPRSMNDCNCNAEFSADCSRAFVWMNPSSDSSSFGSTPDSPESGDLRLFSQEIYAHDASLKAHLRHSFPTVRDVDDVVQESYLRVWQRQLVRPIDSVKGFLFQVARHLALDHIRHERVSPVGTVTDFDASRVIDNSRDIAESASTNQEIEILLAALESLPARCRQIVILRKLQGMSQKEIAAKLGISEQTVQVQACRGLRRCSEYMRRRGVDRSV